LKLLRLPDQLLKPSLLLGISRQHPIPHVVDAGEQRESGVYNLVWPPVGSSQSLLPAQNAIPLLLTGVGMIATAKAHAPMLPRQADGSGPTFR
jgi:hypothetical protein